MVNFNTSENPKIAHDKYNIYPLTFQILTEQTFCVLWNNNNNNNKMGLKTMFQKCGSTFYN